MKLDISEYNTKSAGRPCVIYFRSENTELTPGVISRLQEDTNCFIEVCHSWSSLMIQLSIMSSLSLTIPAILVDIEMFKQSDATVNEVIGMISTLHRCLAKPIKMVLGVVVEKECDPAMIRALHDSEIIGLVPCASVFGYEKTLTALKSILAAKPYWSKDVIEIVTGFVVIKTSRAVGITLTERQKQVLQLVCNRGLSNKQIAQSLKITESTVKIHVSAILKEYGVRNRTQLALAANTSLKV